MPIPTLPPGFSSAAKRSTTSQPQRRSVGLFLLFLIPMTAVVARVGYLQSVVADRFVVHWDRTEVAMEPIPARDGRILSADGLELAYDRTRFDVAVHYRWLEEPPNPTWLRQQARQRLAPRDRRNRDRLQIAEAEVLQTRKAFWESLCEAANLSPTRCDELRARIQARIERMANSVENHRTEKSDDERVKRESRDTGGSYWQSAGQLLVDELTTPPARDNEEPVVLKEQLQYHPILSDVAFNVAAAIESAPSRFPSQAVAVQIHSQRVYPCATLASHLIGFRRDADLAAEGRNDEAAPRAAVGGIEQAYDVVLRGQSGLRRVVYNHRREVLKSEVIQPPVDGRDVTLTFDSSLQNAAEQIVDAAIAIRPSDTEETGEGTPAAAPPQGATLVAIDIATGEVVAAAAAPRFDLSLYSRFDETAWQQASNDPRHPFFPRTTALAAAPGSVFKVLTAIAALESGAISDGDILHCQGFLDRPDQLRCMIYRQHGASHGDLTIEDALCQSCNVFFFQAARKMPADALRLWAERFGFGAPTGIDIPGETGGRLPPARRGAGRANVVPGSTLQFAIGQSAFTASPLQIARMMAAVANGGRLVTPRLAKPAVPTQDEAAGVILASAEISIANRIPDLSPRTLAIVREGLLRVVNDDRGTGKSVRVEGVSVAGKTGTAETGGGRSDHAWFAGYAPADRPRIAFVVMLEHAGSGGKAAGPVAKQFVEALLQTGQLRKRSADSLSAASAERRAEKNLR